jgi:hypothetical protein
MPRTDRLLTAAVAPLWAASALGWAVTVAVSQPLAWRRPVRTAPAPEPVAAPRPDAGHRAAS